MRLPGKSKRCRLCGRESLLISSAIGVCNRCLRERADEAIRIVDEAHRRARIESGLPPETPSSEKGVPCGICSLRCRIPPGGKGFCGVVINKGGALTLVSGSFLKAPGLVYLDPHPTNCVADWVCPGATGAGFPKYSLSPRGPERGYYNIAVFYGSCNLDCLFCQNWEYRRMASSGKPVLSVDELVSMVSPRTTCVCFFGGDPGPNMVHALTAARQMIEEAVEKGLKVFRVCWETNGLMARHMLKKAIDYSIRTGGIIKVDVKAWSPGIYRALTGNDGRMVFDNIKVIAEKIDERPEVPLLVVSTLLVPGYVDEYEVEGIARFLAEINPDIPYRLLAFHPDYRMKDLPRTSRRHALKALEVAKRAGLRNVSIGNWWLLSDAY